MSNKSRQDAYQLLVRAIGWLDCDAVHHDPHQYHSGAICPVIEKVLRALEEIKPQQEKK